MSEIHDLAIIGGGINGCGIARDAAGRGASVYLCEKNDLASATSSCSTKLIHGGLRYLEYYEFRLVREALIERERLWAIAPHIIEPLRFVLPHHAGLRPAWLLRLGLFLYDHLGGRRALPATRGLDLARDVAGAALKPGLFARGFEYSDCRVDDARLTVLNALGARELGAVIEPRTEALAARREGGLWHLELTVGGTRKHIRARALVNAAGPWVAEVMQRRLGLAKHAGTRLVQGSHIVVRRLFAHDKAYIFQNADGRIVFAIPFQGDFTLIGTTDRDYRGDDPGAAQATHEEIDYLCAAANACFAQQIGPGDIVWSYSGVRPLYDDGAGEAKAATRDYVLELDDAPGQAPALAIFGGKITTYRRLAEAVLDKLAPHVPALRQRRGWTQAAPLPGGDFPMREVAALERDLAARFPFLPAGLATRLARSYGTRSFTLLQGCHRDEDLGRDFGAGLFEREVRYLCEQEWAQSAEDILWRRSKLGLRLGEAQARALSRYLAECKPAPTMKVPPMKKLLLAIDQGTTSSRALIFQSDLTVAAVAQQEFAQHFPASGWVEHDPEAIWRSTLHTLREAMAKAGAPPAALAGIGITNQRETTVVWSRTTGQASYNAIVWQDRRTAEHCAALRAAGHGEEVARKTGLLLDPYFSATKIAWILDHVAGARARAERGELLFGTIDSFLLWRLTGGALHATDATNAARSMLFDIHRGVWDEALCRLFRVPMAMLPQVRDCAAEFGVTQPEILGAAVPILGMAGDQQAALIGQACFVPGMAKATYGTGCFALLNTGAKPVSSQNRLLTTIAYQFAGRRCYALEGAIFVAGAGVQWLRDGLGIIQNATECDALAAKADAAQAVYLVPAFVGLGAPYWDAEARGALFGLTRATSRREIVRAVLESVGYQTLDLIEAMRADWGGGADTVLRVDGGMTASDFTMQFLADILAAPVDRPQETETTALGAAYLAGFTAGFLPAPEAFGAGWALQRRFLPALESQARQAKIAGWRDAMARTRSGRGVA